MGSSPSEVSALVNPDVLAKVLFNVFAKFSVRVRGQEDAVFLEFVMGVFFPRRWQKSRLTKVRPGFMFLVAYGHCVRVSKGALVSWGQDSSFVGAGEPGSPCLLRTRPERPKLRV
jgi:hypothetical protein